MQRLDKLGKYNVLFMNLNTSTEINLEVKPFGSLRLPFNSIQELEQDSTITDAVYVGAASAADLRSAFRNFFTDAKEFCKKIHTAQNG